MINWHKRSFLCPVCAVEMAILEILASADDEIRVGLWCDKCGKDYTWICNWARIRAQCILQDMTNLFQTLHQSAHLKQLPATAGLTADDKTLLGEMHIKPD